MRINKKLMFSFVFVALLLSATTAQYYEFTGHSGSELYSYTGFQQGCTEQYDIYFDTEGVTGITVGQPLVILDDTRISYVTGGNLRTDLFNLNISNPEGFIDWVSPSYPLRDINYTKIFLSAQNEDNTAVDGYNKYGYFKFIPKYNYTSADFVFDYDGSNSKTSLAKGGINVINSVSQNSHLTGTISIEQKPCLRDTAVPSVTINIPSGSNYVVNNGLDIDLKDNTNQGYVPYVRTGGSVWTGNIWFILNQYGIASGTINVQVSGNSHNVTLSNISDFNRTPSNKTWEYKDRDYNITTGSSALFDFGVENEITIDVSIDDRVGNSSSFTTYTFNTPVAPVISSQDPADGDIFVLLDSDISFAINDAWAGVNTGTVVVTLSGVSQSASSYHYVFSGSDLNFVLNHGSVGLGNSGGYDVTVNPGVDFPSSGNIMVLVSGADFKGLYTDDDWTFTTRPSCESMACCDSIVLQTGYSSNIWTGEYTGSSLYVSGGNNPQLVWTSGDYTGYVDCNNESGGLSIYSGHGDNFPAGDFVAYQELSGLVFSGQNLKAVLTGVNGDTILLYRFGNFIIKIYPGARGNTTNPNLNGFENRGRLLFYAVGDRTTVVYSGYIDDTNNEGTGEYIEDIESGDYDIVYKGRHHLSSFISGMHITGGQEIILDFTTGVNLYGVESSSLVYNNGSGYQIAGDMFASNNEYDYEINSTDLSVLYGSECPYGTQVGSPNNSKHKCDLNNDGWVDSSDASVIIAHDWYDDLVYGDGGEGFEEFGSVSY